MSNDKPKKRDRTYERNYCVEYREGDRWLECPDRSSDRSGGLFALADFRARFPDNPARLVRVTVVTERVVLDA